MFVSGKGIDSASCGTVASPWRTFQQAHDNTAAGGEVIVRDSGDYGPVRITQSISIANDGAGTASVRGGVKIDRSLGLSGTVLLRGLSITGSGIYAIDLGSLTIINCVVRQAGISLVNLAVKTSFSISHTIVAENGNRGISLAASAADGGSFVGVIDHVLAYNNSDDGISLGLVGEVTIIGSVLANNGGAGSRTIGGDVVPMSVTLRNVTAIYNENSGLVFGDGTNRIAHSVATGNDFEGVTAVGAVVESYGDNNLRDNTSGNDHLTLVAPQ
ncbi:MAG: right-handed parallel beta-helix repeat-containing protein [Methylocella sp.]